MLNMFKKISKNRNKIGGVLVRSIAFSVFILSIGLLISKSLNIHYLREVDSAKTLQEQYEKDMAGDYDDEDYMLDDPLLEEPSMDDYITETELVYDYEEEIRSIKGDNTAVYAAGSITLTNDFMTQLEGYYTKASVTKLSFLYSATSGFSFFGTLQGASIYYNPNNVAEVEVVYSGEMYAPVDCSLFFSCCVITSGENRKNTIGITIEQLILKNFNTSNTTNMVGMFYYSQVKSLDLTCINTSKVTDMFGMFAESFKIEKLNISSFDVSKVINFGAMFYNLQSLNEIDVSKFNTSSGKVFERFLGNCYSLKSIDVSNFNTSNVTNMSKMFDQCKSLTNLDVSNFDTSNVFDMKFMFRNCHNLKSLDVSGFDTSNVTEMMYMFYGCRSLTTLNVKNFNTSNVVSFGSMFQFCENLEKLDVSSFDTSNAFSMYSMFNACYKLQELDVSNFNTRGVNNFSHMFGYSISLISLDISNFVMDNATDINGMFDGCKKIKTIKYGQLNTNGSNINIARSFFNCVSLEFLDLSLLNLNKLNKDFTVINGETTIEYTNEELFLNCPSLHTIIAPSALPTDFSIELPSNFCIEGDYNTHVSTFTESGKTYYRCYDINYTYDNESTLDSNAPTYYVYSQGIQTLPSCTKENYVFKSWYKEDTFENTITSISTTQTGDINLYAKFLYDLQNNISQTNQSVYEYSQNNIYYKLIDKNSSIELNNIPNIKIEYYINGEYTSTVPDNLSKGSYAVRINKDTQDDSYSTINNLIIPNALVIEPKDISSCDIKEIEDQVYKGVYLKPTIYIVNTNNNEELSLYDTTTNIGDYTLAFENNLIIGTATVEITGRDNYKGQVSITFNIVGKTLENTDDLLMYYELPYYLKTSSGTMLGSLETILNNNSLDSYCALWQFVESNDFKYSTILQQGSYVLDVECKPKKDYIDKYASLYSQILIIVENVTPTIKDISLSEEDIILSKTYDTKPINSISFKYNNELITLNLPNEEDNINITFTLNGNVINGIPVNAGIYLTKITISSDDIYDEISAETYITINKRAITSSMISNILDQDYVGTQIIPEITVSYIENDELITLKPGIDYTVFGGSNISSEGCVYVVGQGNYTTDAESSGYTYKYFNIIGGGNTINKDDSEVIISYIYNNNLTYNGKSQIPTFEIYDATDSSNSIKLEEGTDYTISVVSTNTTNVQIGISVKIEFNGSYSGYEFKTYNINAYTLTSSNVDSEGNVKANNTTLVENQDYTKQEVKSETKTVSANTESVKYLYTGINNYDGQFTVTLSEEIEELQYFKFKDSDTYKFSEISTGIILNEVEHTSGNKGETSLYLESLILNISIKEFVDLLENSTSQTTTIKVYSSNNSLISSIFYKSKGITTNMRFNLYDSNDNLLDSFSIIIRGDINGDGKINSSDSLLIQTSMKGNYNEFIYYIASDINKDGVITAKDFKLIA